MESIFKTKPQYFGATAERKIRVELSQEVLTPGRVVKNITAIEGPADFYCWYEGRYGLPKLGAQFMKDFIFKPLYAAKKDVKFVTVHIPPPSSGACEK